MTLYIDGIVTVKNGRNVFRGHNTFLNRFKWSLMGYLKSAFINDYGSLFNYQDTGGAKIYLGTDTTTPTTPDMSSLVSPIGTSPGTAPNSMTGTYTNPSNGVYDVTYIAQWNPGTVLGTVGEIALYLHCADSFDTSFAAWYVPTGAIRMASRLSVADGTLTSFTIDDTKPLTVTWTIEVSWG